MDTHTFIFNDFFIPSTISHFTSSYNHSIHYTRCIPISCLSCLFCACSAPPCRRADITQLRNLTSQRKIWENERLTAAALLVQLVSKQNNTYASFIFLEIRNSSSACMAAAVRNNVWVAPGQDAQFLHKTAPLTAGLRGEDHGQVLSNTRDAIPGTSSYHDNNLVGDYVFAFASVRASQCLLMPLRFAVERCC